MQITYTGHGVSVTPALKEFTTQKFDRLHRHYENINTIHVTFDIENIEQIAEASIIVKGSELHAKARSSEDMYSAIDTLIDKLDRLLIKYKERTGTHRD
jgi:putative sigma-54 modulation protein